jgi:ribonucleoside-diphosphate reductase alpha chain
MWENRDYYNGISVLPFDNGTYKQTPFEEVTEDRYNEMVKLLDVIDLTKVIEERDNTDLQGELACSSGGCTIT